MRSNLPYYATTPSGLNERLILLEKKVADLSSDLTNLSLIYWNALNKIANWYDDVHDTADFSGDTPSSYALEILKKHGGGK